MEARRDLQRRLSLLREQGLDPRHGSLSNLAYNDRFNLRAEDTHLLPPPRAAERASDKTPASAWGFYCRFLLCKDCFYKFEGLRPDLYLYVAETKSVPNRVPPGPREACGRPLVVAWFEKKKSGRRRGPPRSPRDPMRGSRLIHKGVEGPWPTKLTTPEQI